jgi:hypothetical protein
MDDRGCPADPVFPGLTKENGTGALIGRFEAFKFSDSKKTLCDIWGQCYKTFYGRKLRLFIIC